MITILFSLYENYIKVLQERPWFIGSQYLSMRHWEPKFNPLAAHISISIIWVRLQEHPTEYYDVAILKKVGQIIGELIKIDNSTV